MESLQENFLENQKNQDESTQKKPCCKTSMVVGALSHAADDFVALGIWVGMAVQYKLTDQPVPSLLYGLIVYGGISGAVETRLALAENDLENLKSDVVQDDEEISGASGYHDHSQSCGYSQKNDVESGRRNDGFAVESKKSEKSKDSKESSGTSGSHGHGHGHGHNHRKLPWGATGLMYLGSIIMNAVRFYNITISLADAKTMSPLQSLANPCDVAWSKFTAELAESPYQSIAVACVLTPAVYFNVQQALHSLSHVDREKNACGEMTKAMIPTMGYAFAMLSLLGISVDKVLDHPGVDGYQIVVAVFLTLAIWMFSAVRQGLEFSADGGRFCDKDLPRAAGLTLFTLAGDMPVLGPVNPDLKVLIPSMFAASAVGLADNKYHLSMWKRLKKNAQHQGEQKKAGMVISV